MTDKNDTPELLPCPFCGKAARMFKEGRNYDYKPLFQVRCTRSRCEIGTKYYTNPKRTRRVWNTRATPPATEALGVDELKKQAIKHFSDIEGSKYGFEFGAIEWTIDYLASRNLLRVDHGVDENTQVWQTLQSRQDQHGAAKDDGGGQHKWDADGERCVKCGDKDWMGGPCSGYRTPPLDAKALGEFVKKYPTWWYRIGVCDLTRDFTAAPQSHSPEAVYIEAGNEWDGGFSCDHPGTLDDAINQVMDDIEAARALLRKGEDDDE